MMTRRLATVAAVALFAMPPAAMWADEPAQQFLEALRERNYYDVALDYLTAAEKNPSIPASFKETILYEKGTTLVQGARFQRDSVLREQQLDDAQKTLQQFVTAQPNHLYAAAARSQLGNVIVERARSRVEKAKKLTAAEKQPLLKQARDLYDEGGKVFAALTEELRAKLKTYPAALDEKKDAKKIEERDRYRQGLFRAEVLGGGKKEEMGET